MPKIILNYRPNARRRLGRYLKRLFDEAETHQGSPFTYETYAVYKKAEAVLVLFRDEPRKKQEVFHSAKRPDQP